MSDSQTTPDRPKRGFAAMTPEERRRIASLGGIAAQRSGHGHQFTSKEGRAAAMQRKDRQNKSGARPAAPVNDSASKE